MRSCLDRIRGCFILLSCAVAILGLAAGPVHAQTENSGYVIRDLVAALNRGDSVGASVDLTPDFVLALADGTQTTGANAKQTLATLATPITVVSLMPQGNMLVYTVLQFGAAPPVWVTFTGKNAHLATMTIGGPAS